ncbi:endonuclease/exonuclease/phosphatase family protein [Limnobacter litoralis]|uniref:Endonuclease/exonuclease/phosphatase n=1 Tax=Limnobacter litoralis TaxID=481366 RepID=A0ABQ5YQU9_9BURK|nr:endonuclease/exonuclease/phosphatase family protein [Limnobacter litoralis]GLR25646.1 endonuclease/exonuclease/phosphatase [Limnobacter litoralis]
MKLRIASYNIHKGVMGLKGLKRQSLTIHALRDQLHSLGADLVFLQEVQGRHDRHAGRFEHWPEDSQHDFLSKTPSAVDDLLGHSSQRYFSAYGMNAVYPHGHHGNALLSKHPIEWSRNEDVSDHRLEQRGLLHCRVNTPAGPVHTMVAHFGLFKRSRIRQASQLVQHVHAHVPPDAPLIIAGDFNDWQRIIGPELEAGIGVREVLPQGNGLLGRVFRHGSFPCRFPVFGLDRVFCRGFEASSAQVLSGPAWAGLSDHAPFVVDLTLGAGH